MNEPIDPAVLAILAADKRRTRKKQLIAAAVVLALIVGGAVWFIRAIRGPLEALDAMVTDVQRGDLRAARTHTLFRSEAALRAALSEVPVEWRQASFTMSRVKSGGGTSAVEGYLLTRDRRVPIRVVVVDERGGWHVVSWTWGDPRAL
jgi:hypothetical protein